MPTLNNRRLFSLENPKSAKAEKYGYLNAIHYMAPHTLAGVGNLCPHASPGCMAACLGEYSGHAAIHKPGRLGRTQQARREKAQLFMRDRTAYLNKLALEIAALERKARKLDKKLVIRLNGSTDIAFEGLKFPVREKTWDNARRDMDNFYRRLYPYFENPHTLFDWFPRIQFVDYTKNPNRMTRNLPPNYHLTFSRSETNETQALELLNAGHNVAVVFDALPTTWHGFEVIDGDQHDLRHLDKRGAVVGLVPKGKQAKADRSGFVVQTSALGLAA